MTNLNSDFAATSVGICYDLTVIKCYCYVVSMLQCCCYVVPSGPGNQSLLPTLVPAKGKATITTSFQDPIKLTMYDPFNVQNLYCI